MLSSALTLVRRHLPEEFFSYAFIYRSLLCRGRRIVLGCLYRCNLSCLNCLRCWCCRESRGRRESRCRCCRCYRCLRRNRRCRICLHGRSLRCRHFSDYFCLRILKHGIRIKRGVVCIQELGLGGRLMKGFVDPRRIGDAAGVSAVFSKRVTMVIRAV